MNKSVLILLLAMCMTSAAGWAEGSQEQSSSEAIRQRSPGNMTYYIDPVHGDDSHSGLGQTVAWRTFNRINQMRLSAGDRVEVMPGSFDQTLFLMGDGLAEAPVEIRFAPGRYDFYPTRAVTRAYQISNTNDAPDSGKAIGILLDGARHFNISGPGAEIFYRGKMIEVCIDRCEDISISDLHFDYFRPTVSEFRVTAMGEGFVDLEIHKDSHYAIEDGEITWQGEGWSYTTGLAQALDLRTNEVWRRGDPLKGMVLEEIEPFLIRARGKHDMTLQHVYQIRDTRRDCAGVFTRRSRNITWKNVQFQFLHGMGLVNQFSENLTFDTIVVAPDKTSGRTTAAWADCIQVSGCKGKVLVKNCLFSGAHDDAINIHGTHLRVVERVSERQIKVRFMHGQTFGFLAFNPGDEITFVRWDSLKLYGPNRVQEAKLLNPKELLLTLDRPVPADFKQNDAVENVTWTPDVEIRGCTVSRIPTRGFLITTRRQVLVEDNEFLATHMSAVLVEDDAKGWFESGCVRDMTLRKNRFIRCGEPVIHINPQNSVANDAVHQNIRIEENEFVLRDTVALRAKSTRGLMLTGNTLYAQRPLHDGVAIQTSDCSNVTLEKNRYLPLSERASAETLIDKRPNIVVMLADDMGFGELQCLNPRRGKIQTPQLDSIAGAGMIFTDGHSGSSVCTPTRYGLMTGRYAWRTRLQNGVLTGGPSLIAKDRLTLARLLKQTGYHTAMFGKWHLGMLFDGKKAANEVAIGATVTDGPIDAGGFDEFHGFHHARQIKIWIDNDTVTEHVKPIEMLPKLCAGAVDYIQGRKGQKDPFFLYVPWSAPHSPVVPSARWQGKSGLNAHADFVMQTDDSFGQIIKALRDNDMLDTTLVICSSDNGTSAPTSKKEDLEAMGHFPSGDLRGSKADIWDGGHRVPFIALWPNVIEAGSQSDTLLCLTDVLATVAEVVGFKLPPNAAEDSMSFLPALMGKDTHARTSLIHHSISGYFAIRQDNYKLILCPGSGGWTAPKPNAALWKKVEEEGEPTVQLYDMTQDLGEQKNLAARLPEKVEGMRALLQKQVDEGRTTPGSRQANDVTITIRKDPRRKEISPLKRNSK